MARYVTHCGALIMKNKKVIFIVALFVISAPFLKLAADSNKQKLINVAVVNSGGLKEHLVATGRLAYESQLNLDSQIVSTVTKVLVDDGEKVTKGQPLIQLDSFELDTRTTLLSREYASHQVELAIAKSKEQDAQRKHKINQALLHKKLIGKEQFELSFQVLNTATLNTQYAETKLLAKQAEVDKVKGLRRFLTIKAPTNGLITSVNAAVGENVYPNQMNVDFNFLISVADDSAVYADVKIDERSLANVYKGQEAIISLAAFPDKEIKGTVSFIYPTVDTSAQGIRSKIRVRLNPQDLESIELRQNMSCLVKILLSETTDGTIIPMQAIVERNDTQFVYTFDGEKVSRRFVETGNSDFQTQHILQGLEAGENVVVGPMDVLVNLSDGQYARTEL